MRRIGKIGLIITLVGLTSGLSISTFIVFDMYNKLNDLTRDYNDLMEDYTDLLNNYSGIFTNYNALQHAFEEPLTNPDIPSYFEFKNWLDNDNTDTFNYINETWMCGDFSAMLMTRAKTMNWRVRIAVMEYSLVTDPNYNVNTHEGAYGHAFCFILCSDSYIYYIEPQTDAVWYWSTVEYHFEIWQEYDFTAISDTVWGENWLWVNYYNYFG